MSFYPESEKKKLTLRLNEDSITYAKQRADELGLSLSALVKTSANGRCNSQSQLTNSTSITWGSRRESMRTKMRTKFGRNPRKFATDCSNLERLSLATLA